MNHVHKFEAQMGDDQGKGMCECGLWLTVSEGRRIVKKVIKALNALGFTGGFYTYKSSECSCCYGNEGDFFEVNYNIPNNWSIKGKGFCFKFAYQIGDKAEAERFRDALNRIASYYFGDFYEKADSNYQAGIITIY